MNQRIFNLAIVVCLVIVALFGAFSAIRSDPVASAQAVTTPYNTYNILTFNGITQSVSGNVLAQPYGVGDCYAWHTEAVTPTDAQTVTFALYHGPNAAAAYSVSLYSYSAQTTNTIAFTHTPLYGNYLWAAVSLGVTTRPITGVVVCSLKNLQ